MKLNETLNLDKKEMMKLCSKGTVAAVLKNKEKCCRFFNTIDKAIAIGIKDKADIINFLQNHIIECTIFAVATLAL